MSDDLRAAERSVQKAEQEVDMAYASLTAAKEAVADDAIGPEVHEAKGKGCLPGAGVAVGAGIIAIIAIIAILALGGDDKKDAASTDCSAGGRRSDGIQLIDCAAETTTTVAKGRGVRRRPTSRRGRQASSCTKASRATSSGGSPATARAVSCRSSTAGWASATARWPPSRSPGPPAATSPGSA